MKYEHAFAATARPRPQLRDPCRPSPCGSNAKCVSRGSAGSCVCLPQYTGDPYSGCRPECVLNADCPRNKACVNNRCRDPCPGLCGPNAQCSVANHVPACYCLPGFTGNPVSSCQSIPRKTLVRVATHLLCSALSSLLPLALKQFTPVWVNCVIYEWLPIFSFSFLFNFPFKQIHTFSFACRVKYV